jgi:nicotinate-nucleotide adenylyltransferase
MEQNTTKLKKIGLLGGTFDPVHKGHLAVAGHILHTLGLDAIWFIPAATPPHKIKHGDGEQITDFQDRVTMLEKALAPFGKFQINLIESERTSPSYSIETLIELQKRTVSNTEFFFILGVDAFAEIDTWKRYRELTDFVDLVIISRGVNDIGVVEDIIREKFPDYQAGPLTNIWYSEDHKGVMKLVSMKPVPISSTMVREKVRADLSFSDIVPPEVEEFIRTKNIYRQI